RPMSCKSGATVDRPPPRCNWRTRAVMGAFATATAPSSRARIYALLRYSDPTPAAPQGRVVSLLVLGSGLLAGIVASIDELEHGRRRLLRVTIWTVTFTFLAEYLLRLWAAPEAPRYDQDTPLQARLHWARSVEGLINLLAVTPAFLFAGGYAI